MAKENQENESGTSIKIDESTDEKVETKANNIVSETTKNISCYSFIKEFIEYNKNDVQKSKIFNMLKENIDNELKNMLKIDDDDDLMSLALNELDISEASFNNENSSMAKSI